MIDLRSLTAILYMISQSAKDSNCVKLKVGQTSDH